MSPEREIVAAYRLRGFQVIAGVDEVGRGPLAGPVLAAAIVLPEAFDGSGIDDSKRLTAERREELFHTLTAAELDIGVGIMDHEAIDRWNIHRASLMAMRKAVLSLRTPPHLLLIDGRHSVPGLSIPQSAVIQGDRRCQVIGAASIIAKVLRDRLMTRFEELYPQYAFSVHKGYPTPQHLEEIRRHGICPIHRRSFRPVAAHEEQYALF